MHACMYVCMYVVDKVCMCVCMNNLMAITRKPALKGLAFRVLGVGCRV